MTVGDAYVRVDAIARRIHWRGALALLRPRIAVSIELHHVVVTVAFDAPDVYGRARGGLVSSRTPMPAVVISGLTDDQIIEWLVVAGMRTAFAHELDECLWLDGKAPWRDPHGAEKEGP